MGRKVGMGILRMLSLMGCASILAIFVLTAGSAFMPGTKIGHLFGASAEALAGNGEETGGKTLSLREFNARTAEAALDGGTGMAPDAGTVASTPAGQGSMAPAEAQALPEQQGR
jgi:hypothetical protein